MWGCVQRKGWGGLPEPEQLLQFCTDWFSRPRDGEGAPWTHQDKPRRPHPSSSLCCSWREQLPDLLQLELLNIALSYEAREWQTVIPSLLWVAISSAKNIKDGSSHSLQISLFYKSLFVVKRRLLSIPGKEKQWRRQKRRDRSGCSHLFQSEANFAGREMLFARIWRGGQDRHVLLPALGTHGIFTINTQQLEIRVEIWVHNPKNSMARKKRWFLPEISSWGEEYWHWMQSTLEINHQSSQTDDC